MSLVSLINQHALSAAQAGNWQSVADTLNALTTEVRDNTLRTARWLMLQLTDVVNPQTGMTESDVVLGTLQQSSIPRVKAAYDSLVSDGIDLSDDQVQQMIPVLAAAASWPAGLADKILQAGRQNVPVLSPSTTPEDCQSVWESEIRTQRNGNLKSRFDSILNQIGTSEHSEGIAALRAMADELEVL